SRTRSPRCPGSCARVSWPRVMRYGAAGRWSRRLRAPCLSARSWSGGGAGADRGPRAPGGRLGAPGGPGTAAGAPDPRDPLGLAADAPMLAAWLTWMRQAESGQLLPMSTPGHKQRYDLV